MPLSGSLIADPAGRDIIPSLQEQSADGSEVTHKNIQKQLFELW